MTELSERERLLIARGDVAIATMQAVLKALLPAYETNSKTAEQLNAINAKTPNSDPSKPTLLSITAQVTTKTSAVLLDVIQAIETSNNELRVFAQYAGITDTVSDAEGNIINAIRESSDFYRDTSDDEIRKMVGL